MKKLLFLIYKNIIRIFNVVKKGILRRLEIAYINETVRDFS